MSDSDPELLARFVAEGCEDSFANLVRRHLGLVHAAALRQVRSPQLAEEIAQSVFLDLARNAPRLAKTTILSAWLYEVTRRTAIDTIRREVRRQLREQTASEMKTLTNDTENWLQIAPLLDDAMHALEDLDRSALLLRFFDNQSLRAVGTAMGISEDAAQKRVRRALDQLRELLAQRGVSVASGGLAGLLSSQGAPTVSETLVASIATSALKVTPNTITRIAGRTALVSGIRGLLNSGRGPLWTTGALTVALLGGLTWLAARNAASPGPASSLSQSKTVGGSPLEIDPSTSLASPAVAETLPNPLDLLVGVARARQQVVSGVTEFSIATTVVGDKSMRDQTNEVQVKVLFTGGKLRSESVGKEYSYTYAEDEMVQEGIRKSADALDRESAVKAGLLKPFTSHHILVTDGEVLMDFWDTGNGHPSVSLANSDKGHGSFLFDPRCLGLAPYLSQGNSVDACLGYVGTKSISLMGQEIVEGVLTWHVRVGKPSDIHLNFWIDVAYPSRVVRHSSNGKTVVSRYDESDPGNPIPAEVQIYDDRASGLRITQRLLQTGHDLNSPVEETLFTLAGLGMPVGTQVSDVRKMRSMGYWNGTALSEELPAKTNEEPPPPPSLTEQLALLEKSPESPEAVEAAIWIVLNNPDGPAVNTALEVIQSHHIRAPGLLTLCREQERVRHRGSKALLEALLLENPDAAVRGTACFVLATLLKDEAKFGQNVNATAASVQYFERTLAEFGTVTWNGSPVADLAKLELGELRRLSLGQPAPEIVGVDLEGLPMQLSEFRGRVIVLVFWWNKFSEAQEIRKLAEMFPAESFSVVGVFGGRDLEAGRSEAAQRGMTWRSFWDNRDGPIAKEWNVRGWPDVWVLDRQGVIRHRELRGPELRSAVQRLLNE